LSKNRQVIAEFSIIPIGQSGTSVSRYVAAAVDALAKVKDLEFEVTPMGTILAANDLGTVFEAVSRAHEAVVALGAKRVASTLRIDDRRDKPRTMNDKVKAVQDHMKKEKNS